MVAIKSRFAPSPTGYLHVGSVRTALFAWLAAKHAGGQCILRIEDTDLDRSHLDYVDAILEGLRWIGLAFDEGPIFQSDRLARYREVADQLEARGLAYRCYCSKERLEALRETQIAAQEKTRYDGTCRSLERQSGEAPFVLRFKNPSEGVVSFEDCVRGLITVDNKELDDLVLVRQDGIPTYNFAVVVDDYDMGITHVVRGDDHISNTPRQLNIFAALGWQPPIYAHIPMILGEDGKRLSKRHGAQDVLSYRDEGFLPQALLNYLVRLGWSFKDQEIFSLTEMIEYFDLKHLSHSPACLNPQKLEWLNQHYMKTLPTCEVIDALIPFFEGLEVDLMQGPAIAEVFALQSDRFKTLKAMAQGSLFFYRDPVIDAEALPRLQMPGVKRVLETALVFFKAQQGEEVGGAEIMKQHLQALCSELSAKMGEVGPPIRIAVTGTLHSPALDKTLALIGITEICKRIEQILQREELFVTL